jgi:hypothetical protein
VYDVTDRLSFGFCDNAFDASFILSINETNTNVTRCYC